MHDIALLDGLWGAEDLGEFDFLDDRQASFRDDLDALFFWLRLDNRVLLGVALRRLKFGPRLCLVFFGRVGE